MSTTETPKQSILDTYLLNNNLSPAEYTTTKTFYQDQLNTTVTPFQYRRIIKLANIIRDYGTDNIRLVINRNLRYAKARGRHVIKIGQTNDKLKGYPISIVWAELKQVCGHCQMSCVPDIASNIKTPYCEVTRKNITENMLCDCKGFVLEG
jgi:hypothetical protein